MHEAFLPTCKMGAGRLIYMSCEAKRAAVRWKVMSKREKLSYEAIFEGTGLLLVGLDAEGRIVAFNQAAEKTTGFTREEVIGRSMWDFAIPDESREADAAYLESFRRGELVDTLEQYLLTRDGRKRLISWRATSTGAGKGRPDIILAVGMDITERRLADEALASSEGFFRMLIENALDLITVLGADGRMIYVSPAVERLLGYDQEEMVGRNIMEFIYPDDKAAARTALAFAMSRTGITGDIELRIRRKDGGWRIHEATSFNLLHDPQVKGMVINSRDITERSALVSSLLESEENYRVTFESTGSAMVVLGLDGTILDANQEMQRLLGYAREDVVGKKKYMEFVHPEDREEVKRYSLRLLKGELKGPVRYEARTVRRDGRVLNTIINVSVLPGMDKSVASLVDITEKKDYELELEARAAQLRDFLDIAAHELRHPATLIKGFAMTLADFGGEMSHKEINDSLSAIVRGVEKLTSVVDDLLDVSRIERGFMSLERGEHDLPPLLRSAVDEMLARGGGRPIEIASLEDPGPAWLDPEKFTRLVVILLDNAVKYSPPGSLIEVSLGASEGGALVSVLDRGGGIPDRERSLIFDRFYQSDEVLHHSSPGLGLGLYIAKRIVEAHGGRIWCEEREGGGSAFRFTIPLRGEGATL